MSKRTWTKHETLVLACGIVELARVNPKGTNKDVFDFIKHEIDRTPGAVAIEAYRFVLAAQGLFFNSDDEKENYLESYTRRRDAAKLVNIQLLGSDTPVKMKEGERQGTTQRRDVPCTEVRRRNIHTIANMITLVEVKHPLYYKMHSGVRNLYDQFIAEGHRFSVTIKDGQPWIDLNVVQRRVYRPGYGTFIE